MKLIATRKSDQNEAMLDPWTVVHFGFGLAAGLVGVRFGRLFAAAVVYEVAENVAERQPEIAAMFQTSGPESLPNAVVDVGIMSLGWWLGQRYNRG